METWSALRRQNGGLPLADRVAVPGSAMGLCCRGRPDDRQDILSSRQWNGPLPFKMGVPGIGGPMITKGGVTFLSGTLDYFARACHERQKLWESRLPAGGQATPTYWSEASGRLVVVAGGRGSTGTEAGDSIIAYALPKSWPGPPCYQSTVYREAFGTLPRETEIANRDYYEGPLCTRKVLK